MRDTQEQIQQAMVEIVLVGKMLAQERIRQPRKGWAGGALPEQLGHRDMVVAVWVAEPPGDDELHARDQDGQRDYGRNQGDPSGAERGRCQLHTIQNRLPSRREVPPVVRREGVLFLWPWLSLAGEGIEGRAGFAT